MCMADDGEGFEVFDKKTVRAAIAHKCGECNRTIEPGERYEYGKGMYDKNWDTFKTCAHCVWARTWLLEQCQGFLYNGVLFDLEEHWEEEHLLRSLDLGRRVIAMRRRWKRRYSDDLMAVPA